MLKAAAYTRYSTLNQSENSTAYQLEAIRKYCKEHDITIVATYSDDSDILRPSQKVLIKLANI